LTDLLTNLRRTLTTINAIHDKSTSSTSSVQDGLTEPNAELERLQGVIEKLQTDLREHFTISLLFTLFNNKFTENSREQASSQAVETQSMFDRFAADHRLAIGRSKGSARNVDNDLSVDLITAPARDEERERLETQKHELEEERAEFTEATIRLGKERATLEVTFYFSPVNMELTMIIRPSG
jgi:hypothetical protein